jgi:D-alanyl-D-alanine carboxypeptidase
MATPQRKLHSLERIVAAFALFFVLALTIGFAQAQSQKVVYLRSSAVMVQDADTGEVVLNKNSDAVVPIASITKLMTAVVALETMPHNDMATVSARALATYGRAGNLRLNDRLSIKTLLYPLILESSNDASEVIAEHAGRANFMRSMNTTARRIGMENTNFEDPSGLSPRNVSTGYDLVALTRYVREHHPELLTISQLPSYQHGWYTWRNNTRFLRHTNYLGGKNGYIPEAGRTIVATFEVPISTTTGSLTMRPLVLVLLDMDNVERSVARLLDHVREHAQYSY